MSGRFALVIGNEHYDDPALNTGLHAPKQDVEELASVLGDPTIGRFEVTKVLDKEFAEVRDRMSEFLADRSRDDTLLIYFSGHGIKDSSGSVYLAVKDTRKQSPWSRGIDNEFLRKAMERCRSQRQVLILDCCYSGAWASGRKGVAEIDTESTFLSSGYGHVIITATNAVQEALEADQLIPSSGYSLFTHHLIEGLQTGLADGFPNGTPDGEISEFELYEYAFKQTEATKAQSPQRVARHEGAPIVVARNPAFDFTPAELLDLIKLTTETSRRDQKALAASALGEYLKDSDPRLVALAKNVLEGLLNDTSPMVADAARNALEKQNSLPGVVLPSKRMWKDFNLALSVALLVTVLAAVGAYWWKHRSQASLEQKKAIAVLPLQNMNGDFAVDYLRFALADELTSMLTYSRSLEVRPSSLTRRYAALDLDPRNVGQELHVGWLLTGHFARQDKQISVTLEAIDVSTDGLSWQATVTVPVDDLISLQNQLSTQVQQGLLPALGAGGTLSTSSRPKSQEAYDLYLHALAQPHDTVPNKDAIAVLEHVVSEDPGYAPAWEALGLRYYYDSYFGGGGEQMFQRSNAAFEKAVALDPNRMLAASHLIENHVERGDLGRAYDAVTDLVKRRPQSADAHFAFSYVLRYAGMLEQATQECNAARSLDPANFDFRSCAWAFLELGKTDRGMDFVHLDAGSEWATWVKPYVYLAEGNLAQARDSAKSVAKLPAYHRELIVACTQDQRPRDMDRIVREAEASVMTEPDPESWYHVGALMAYCGQKDAALRLLEGAVQRNYCAYSALLEDPLLKDLRKETAFNAVLTAGSKCQETLKEGRQ